MALINTDTLDVPSRGLPALGITSIVSLDTQTLDVPSRGIPAIWVQSGAAPASPYVPVYLSTAFTFLDCSMVGSIFPIAATTRDIRGIPTASTFTA